MGVLDSVECKSSATAVQFFLYQHKLHLIIFTYNILDQHISRIEHRLRLLVFTYSILDQHISRIEQKLHLIIFTYNILD